MWSAVTSVEDDPGGGYDERLPVESVLASFEGRFREQVRERAEDKVHNNQRAHNRSKGLNSN